jgi:hypothetical protein
VARVVRAVYGSTRHHSNVLAGCKLVAIIANARAAAVSAGPRVGTPRRAYQFRAADVVGISPPRRRELYGVREAETHALYDGAVAQPGTSDRPGLASRARAWSATRDASVMSIDHLALAAIPQCRALGTSKRSTSASFSIRTSIPHPRGEGYEEMRFLNALKRRDCRGNAVEQHDLPGTDRWFTEGVRS